MLRRLWAERDPRVPANRRLDSDGRPTVAELAARIRDEPDRWSTGLRAVERKDTGAVIGYCGLLREADSDPEEEFAIELLQEAHGQGFATEAARAVVAEAQALGLERVTATVWDWNAPSRRLLDRLGFRQEGEGVRSGPHGATLRLRLGLPA